MTNNWSLRHRVAISLAFFGAAASLALATLIYFFSLDLEDSIIDETLTAELEDYIARRQRNPKSLPERTATIRAYVVNQQVIDVHLPDVVKHLQPGQHTLTLENINYRAAVRKVGEQRFIVLYDISTLTQRENQLLILLAVSVLIVTFFSALLGRRLAARIIAPVTELVRRVAELDPEDEPKPLAHQFPWVEVRELASDFDNYLLRLHDFIERERLFTGDVSHELRTPLAIIDGASNLILADTSIDKKLKKRIMRIARAGEDMGKITSSLLALAREKGDINRQTAYCDCRSVVQEEINRYKEIFHHKSLDVILKVEDFPDLKVDQAILSMVLGNLLRNAFSYTEAGTITIRISRTRFSVEDSGPGIAIKDIKQLTKSQDLHTCSTYKGIGISLVRRLCNRYGWTLSLSNREEGGTLATVDLTEVK